MKAKYLESKLKAQIDNANVCAEILKSLPSSDKNKFNALMSFYNELTTQAPKIVTIKK